MIQARAKGYEAGRIVGNGTFVCQGCNFKVVLEALDSVPECPACGGAEFSKASMFSLDPELADQPTIDQEHAPEQARSGHEAEPEWLAAARAELPGAGYFIAFRDGGELHVRSLPEGWTRVGRSITAGIRLDDPTVSRRHALIVKTEDGRVRVLDDRSMNGLYVNGDQVEWARLGDGDEVSVGRYRLYVLEAVAAPGPVRSATR